VKIPPTVVGGFIQVLSTERVLGRAVIPPTAVGGYFNSFLRKDLNDPPTAVDGIRRLSLGRSSRKDLNYPPPTAVGGI